jgi:CDP-diacylglycerol--glycerol-3-phosphate 3-phosphatidyltransferase
LKTILAKSKAKKKSALKTWVDRTLTPLSRFLHSIHVGPNTVTCAGVLATAMVPVETVKSDWLGAGLWLLAAGFFDLLDGSLAREAHVSTTFGAFWDSTLDRVSESLVFAGFLLYYYQHQQPGLFLTAFGISVLSLLVSYTRARAEGLGIKCEVGILPRPGRVLILAFGFLADLPTGALLLVGVLTLATVAQRVLWVFQRAPKGR